MVMGALIMSRQTLYIFPALLLALTGCRLPVEGNLESSGQVPSIQHFIRGTNSSSVVNPDAFTNLDSLILQSIRNQAFPGAAVAVGKHSEIIKLTGYGAFTYQSEQHISATSLFDLASLTKVVATTTAAMILYEQGKLDLEAPISRYLDAFNTPERQSITIRHLLAHTSGLPAGQPFYQYGLTTDEAVLDSIFSIPLLTDPGKESLYSSIGMITLVLVMEEITGEPFDSWCTRNIFEPLEMESTGFRGTGTTDSTVVPTELDDYFRHRLIQGEVHDETAWIMGGVAGHAGLFSSAGDLTQFARMMVQRGDHSGNDFLQPRTIDLFTAAVDTALSTRALGWDTQRRDGRPSSAGHYFGPRSYGHTGFTGTSIWIDPDSKVWVILLSNRVYPTRDAYERFRGVRGLVADAAYEALFGSSTNPATEQTSR